MIIPPTPTLFLNSLVRSSTLILNLRGTHGSGKSYVVRQFLRMHPTQKRIFGLLGLRRPEAYELAVKGCAKPVYVIGPYNAVCGGLDRIQPYDNIMVLVEKYAKKGHVVFEGVLVSGSYGRLGELLERYRQQVHVLFLDTPLDVCIDQVRRRRDTRGTTTPFDDTNVRKKFASVRKIKRRVEADRLFNSLSVSSDNAAEVMTRLLVQAETQDGH